MRTLTQHLLPHRIIAKIADLSANCSVPWIKNYLINYFIKRYPVKMHEAIIEDPFAYETYNKFFTRQLKPTCRPIDPNINSIVSPADGQIAQIGRIDQDNILQAKGHNFSVQALIGSNELAQPFINGTFATVYLAPKDYHRVHMPLAGKLTNMLYIPGKLFSVNQHAAENIPNLFARNERVVSIFDTAAGKMAVVLVGAMIVGSIETVWAGQITPPYSSKLKVWEYGTDPTNNLELAKGSEMGLFKLGSTVIVLFTPNVNVWDAKRTANSEICMGQKIGMILETER